MLEKFIATFIYVIIYPALFLSLNNTRRTRVAVRCRNEVLVVKARFNLGAWILPGGGIKKNEKPEKAATRELYEETGITFKPNELKLLKEEKIKSRGIASTLMFYEATVSRKPDLKLQKLEIKEAKWVNSNDLKNLPMQIKVKQVLSKLIAA